MQVKDYLDKCKAKLKIESTYALSEHLGISEQVLSNYYNDRRIPDDYACFKIAEILNLDPSYVIADIKASNEKDEKKAEYFREFGLIVKKQSINIILAIACVISLLSVQDTDSDNLLVALASSSATALFMRIKRLV